MNKRLIFLFVSLLALTACSSNSTRVSQLQKEFNQYKYSSYVRDSLKDRPVVAKGSGQDNGRVRKRNIAKLRAVKQQLSSRKKRAGSQLNSVRYQNGIYVLPRSIQSQTTGLNSQSKSERWLKRHASLKAVLAIALKNNLDIQSGQEQAQASLEKYDQVGFLDDMLSQYASFTQALTLTGSTQKHKKNVSAGFPFPGLLALKSSIIDQAVESSRLELKQTVQDVISNTQVAYYKLQFAQQEAVIAKKNIKLLALLREEIKNNYSANTAELSSVLQTEIEIAQRRNQLQIAKSNQQKQQARLNALLNLNPTFSLGNLGALQAIKLNENVKLLVKQSKQKRVEIARLRSELKKMQRIIQLSKKRFYPDFDAGYSRFQNGKLSQQAKIKKTNFFGKNDAYLAETKQKYKALQSKIKALEIRTTDDIQQLLSSYQTQKRTHQLYQGKVLVKANSTLDIAKNLYETGEASYLEVIDAQEMILDYKLLSLRALKEMNVSAAKLKRVVGSH